MLKELKFGNLKLRTKILMLGLAAVILPVLVLGIIGARQNIIMRDVSTEESIKLAKTDLDHVVDGRLPHV